MKPPHKALRMAHRSARQQGMFGFLSAEGSVPEAVGTVFRKERVRLWGQAVDLWVKTQFIPLVKSILEPSETLLPHPPQFSSSEHLCPRNSCIALRSACHFLLFLLLDSEVLENTIPALPDQSRS